MAENKNLASMVKILTAGVVGAGIVAALTFGKGNAGDQYQNVIGSNSAIGNTIQGPSQMIMSSADNYKATQEMSKEGKNAYELKQIVLTTDSTYTTQKIK